MIKRIGDMVEISVEEEQLLKEIAYMQDFLEFMQRDLSLAGEEALEHIGTVTGVIETLQAFYCEHFGEEKEK